MSSDNFEIESSQPRMKIHHLAPVVITMTSTTFEIVISTLSQRAGHGSEWVSLLLSTLSPV